jgi:Asp-tRNA(Asn)/Glu-tRNA(Gln) amidotransferase A subunit family amidase
MARFHADWFEAHAELYGRATRLAIQKGGALADQRLTELRADQHALRSALDERLHSAGADLWITPSSWGPAPEGFEITGTSGMTGPWSYAGLPALSLPAGTAANGLPLGLQCIARWNDDERLLAWARGMESVLRSA